MYIIFFPQASLLLGFLDVGFSFFFFLMDELRVTHSNFLQRIEMGFVGKEKSAAVADEEREGKKKKKKTKETETKMYIYMYYPKYTIEHFTFCQHKICLLFHITTSNIKI